MALPVRIKDRRACAIDEDIVDGDLVAGEHQSAIVVATESIERIVVLQDEADVEANFQRVVVDVDHFIALDHRINGDASASGADNHDLAARETRSGDTASRVEHDMRVGAGKGEVDG